MRRALVLFLLFLFPFQVLAARLDGATPLAAIGASSQLAQTAFMDSHGDSGKMFDLAAQACDDADEPSANFDLGDTLVLRHSAPLPPRGMPLKPEPVLFALASRFPSVPKPPPDA